MTVFQVDLKILFLQSGRRHFEPKLVFFFDHVDRRLSCRKISADEITDTAVKKVIDPVPKILRRCEGVIFSRFHFVKVFIKQFKLKKYCQICVIFATKAQIAFFTVAFRIVRP